MKSLDLAIAKLRRLAAKNAVEVEHLCAMAVLGQSAAVPVIRELQERYSWSQSKRDGGAHVVPLGRWADVVCSYLDGGADALVSYAHSKEPDSFYYAVSVLGDLKSSVAVLALAELAAEVQRDLPKRRGDAVKLAEAVNLTLSFKKPPAVHERTARSLRTFLHALLRQALNEPQRAIVVCALRGVGDESSIALLQTIPPFTETWGGLESAAVNAIRKRLRRPRGGDV